MDNWSTAGADQSVFRGSEAHPGGRPSYLTEAMTHSELARLSPLVSGPRTQARPQWRARRWSCYDRPLLFSRSPGCGAPGNGSLRRRGETGFGHRLCGWSV